MTRQYLVIERQLARSTDNDVARIVANIALLISHGRILLLVPCREALVKYLLRHQYSNGRYTFGVVAIDPRLGDVHWTSHIVDCIFLFHVLGRTATTQVSHVPRSRWTFLILSSVAAR